MAYFNNDPALRPGIHQHHRTENLKTILSTNSKDYEIGSEGALGPLLGSDIFASDGQQWGIPRQDLFCKESLSWTLVKDSFIAIFLTLITITAPLGFFSNCWCRTGTLDLMGNSYVDLGPQTLGD
ncbi:MAG: hypothetical protein M1839_001710 [Geoglossum umbratile]|nr:MAG: hypothetical protein M1839_001710 [Geoglossum umbratile]